MIKVPKTHQTKMLNLFRVIDKDPIVFLHKSILCTNTCSKSTTKNSRATPINFILMSLLLTFSRYLLNKRCILPFVNIQSFQVNCYSVTFWC